MNDNDSHNHLRTGAGGLIMADFQTPVYGDGNKTVFTRLKPSMTREQIKRNLIIALEKSSFTIQTSPKQSDEGDAS